jgi:hypothetical protein
MAALAALAARVAAAAALAVHAGAADYQAAMGSLGIQDRQGSLDKRHNQGTLDRQLGILGNLETRTPLAAFLASVAGSQQGAEVCRLQTRRLLAQVARHGSARVEQRMDYAHQSDPHAGAQFAGIQGKRSSERRLHCRLLHFS